VLAAHERSPSRSLWPLSRQVTLLLLLSYVLGGVILLFRVGPWEAFREVVVNGALVATWLAAVHTILRRQPPRPLPPLRRPRFELLWSVAVLTASLAAVTIGYGQWVSLPRRIHVAIIYAGVVLLFLGLRYPSSAWGLRWPSRRGWLALGAVILLNIAVGVLRVWLPSGEQVGPTGVDLAEEVAGGAAVFGLFLSILLGAAIPEELLLRVLLQPRLAHYLGLSWAVFLQAFLFSLGHLPQKMLGNELPVSVALAHTLLLSNGLIAGYLWYKERSLLLLVLVHLFAFWRLG
jgi:membrane protease YdiL (CAAX protease family)